MWTKAKKEHVCVCEEIATLQLFCVTLPLSCTWQVICLHLSANKLRLLFWQLSSFESSSFMGFDKFFSRFQIQPDVRAGFLTKPKSLLLCSLRNGRRKWLKVVRGDNYSTAAYAFDSIQKKVCCMLLLIVQLNIICSSHFAVEKGCTRIRGEKMYVLHHCCKRNNNNSPCELLTYKKIQKNYNTTNCHCMCAFLVDIWRRTNAARCVGEQ